MKIMTDYKAVKIIRNGCEFKFPGSEGAALYQYDALIIGGGAGGGVRGGGGAGAAYLCHTYEICKKVPIIVGCGGIGSCKEGNQSQTGCRGGDSCTGGYYKLVAPGGYGGGATGCGYTGSGCSGSGCAAGSMSLNSCWNGGGGGGACGCGCSSNSSASGQGGLGFCGYAGGGGGGCCCGAIGSAGCCGGGQGGGESNVAGNATTCGSGGGGGAFKYNYSDTVRWIGGDGAGGIVKICYKTDGSCGITCGEGGTVTTENGYYVHTFTSDGVFKFIS